jgi:hypothetical protein
MKERTIYRDRYDNGYQPLPASEGYQVAPEKDCYDTKIDTRPVEDELTRVSNTVSRLHEIADVISKRLEPYLVPQPPIAQSTCNPKAQYPLSPIGMSIREIDDRLTNLEYVLEDLYKRIER